MQKFRADLHIHTVLSPCGSLEMSPGNIVQSALKAKLDIIAITDHNSTKQVAVVKRMAEKQGLFVIGGAEVNTAEEVHCLALFEHDDQLAEFQAYLDQHLPVVKNNPAKFGYQVVVDEDEIILEEEERLLIIALDAGILEVERKVHSLNGLFIPAHIDRPYNGIISQLGFVPRNLTVDGYGITRRARLYEWESNPRLTLNPVLIRNSDAHRPEDVGAQITIFEMEEISFLEIRKTLRGEDERHIIID
ncbi:MAG TPA: PHP domain-containing protein [Prolixibacteraceae bacterium]|nr:PHP domain-containing protein [Prolixibacteraceae bacterium]